MLFNSFSSVLVIVVNNHVSSSPNGIDHTNKILRMKEECTKALTNMKEIIKANSIKALNILTERDCIFGSIVASGIKAELANNTKIEPLVVEYEKPILNSNFWIQFEPSIWTHVSKVMEQNRERELDWNLCLIGNIEFAQTILKMIKNDYEEPVSDHDLFFYQRQNPNGEQLCLNKLMLAEVPGQISLN